MGSVWCYCPLSSLQCPRQKNTHTYKAHSYHLAGLWVHCKKAPVARVIGPNRNVTQQSQERLETSKPAGREGEQQPLWCCYLLCSIHYKKNNNKKNAKHKTQILFFSKILSFMFHFITETSEKKKEGAAGHTGLLKYQVCTLT